MTNTDVLMKKANEIDKLAVQLQDKVGELRPALKKVGVLQEAAKFLNDKVKAENIVIYANEYGDYDEMDSEWVMCELPVNKQDFIEFLKDQKKKAIDAANKLVDELDATVDRIEEDTVA